MNFVFEMVPEEDWKSPSLIFRVQNLQLCSSGPSSLNHPVLDTYDQNK